jgi:hypothetical protein
MTPMFRKTPNCTLAPEPAQAVRGRMSWLLLLVIFGLAAVLQVLVAGRSGLWADEVFSLALATGHSLEHAAVVADPRQGGFVEPNHPVPAAEFSRYLKHDDPPANPARVVRAVLLSDTEPTTLLSLALRVDDRAGHERYRSSLILDYVRTGFPVATCPYCAAYRSRRFFQLCSFRILPIGNLLFDRRADVLAPVAVRACDDMGFARPTATR